MAEAVELEDDFSEMFSDESECPVSSSTSEDYSSEDSQDESQIMDDWNEVDTRKFIPFSDTPSLNVGTAKTPIEFFKLLFNNSFMNLLVACVNMRAIQIISERFPNHTEFKPASIDELYTFLSVYFLMGSFRIMDLNCYWSENPMYNLKFDHYMKKDRFALIIRSLAYRKAYTKFDNGDARRSWYEAAKPLADLFNRNMKILVVPEKELNIDKFTSYWFNEVNFRKRKPERIRMHLLSDRTGIFQRVYLCHPDGKNKSDDILRELLQDFLWTGRAVYSCPFYTNVDAAEELLKQKTYMTGILKRHKQSNPAFTKKRLDVGSVKARFNTKGVCIISARKAHNYILALSTEHDGAIDECSKKGDTNIISQFKQYTTYMFRRNQTVADNAPCDTPRKYNRSVMYLLHIMLMNAYLMFTISQISSMTYADFRKTILLEILPVPYEDDDEDSDEDTDASIDSTSRGRTDVGEVIHLPAELFGRKRKMRHCRNCWLKHGIRKNTHFFCPQCPQKWGLCVCCFREFHNY